jgi:tetratricopeptide (TPR) repeat protein
VTRARLGLVAVTVLVLAAGCTNRAPAVPGATATLKYPNYPTPDIPASLEAPADIRQKQALGWQQLQTGDLRTASNTFSDILKKSPEFYPAQAGLGFASLADRDFRQAASRFGTVLVKNDRYIPAWLGVSDAQAGLGNDAEAISALEKVIAIDPSRDAVKSRIALLRFRQVQTLLDAGNKSVKAGKLDDAEQSFERALTLSPDSSAVLKALVDVEFTRGELDQAEGHARQAIAADPGDAESEAALGNILEARQQYRDAAAAFTKAASIDPRPEWRTRAKSLNDKADLAAIPPAFRDLSTAQMITRGQVAAFIGLRLPALLADAPKRPPSVMTDIRTDWAAPWIVPVTQAGVMDAYANHTFQPATTVRRIDLALFTSRLLGILPAARQADVTRWRAERPTLSDVPATNVNYRSAAVAVASGAMTAGSDGAFGPTRPATGAELETVLSRIQQLTGR